jgi:hypothetical protein
LKKHISLYFCFYICVTQFMVIGKTNSAQTIVKVISDTSQYALEFIAHVKTSDSSFVTIGYGYPDSGSLDLKSFIGRFDREGNFQNGYYFDSLRITSAIETDDYGFLLSGYKMSFQFTWIIKTDSSFNVQWSKLVHTDTIQYSTPFKLASISNKYYAINHVAANSGTSFLEIIKIDSAGNILDQKAYIDTANVMSIVSDVATTSDGYLLIVASLYIRSTAKDEILIVKADTALNIQWAKIFSGNCDSPGYETKLFSDGSITIVSPPNGGTELHSITKISGSGNLVFAKRMRSAINKLTILIPVETDNYSTGFVGTIYDTTTYQHWAVYTKIDSIGHLVPALKYDYFFRYSMAEMSGNPSLYFWGAIEDSGNTKILFIKTDTSALNICTESPVLILDTDVVVIDSIITFSSFTSDFYFINSTLIWSAMDFNTSELCISSVIDENQGPAMFSIFPQPATSIVSLRAGNSKIKTMKMYNLLGEEMHLANPMQVTESEMQIDISYLPPGIYILQASSGEKVWRGKFIKE